MCFCGVIQDLFDASCKNSRLKLYISPVREILANSVCIWRIVYRFLLQHHGTQICMTLPCGVSMFFYDFLALKIVNGFQIGPGIRCCGKFCGFTKLLMC